MIALSAPVWASQRMRSGVAPPSVWAQVSSKFRPIAVAAKSSMYLSQSPSKLLQNITPTGAYFETESTLTKAEIEIATNLINGKWHAAYSNSEHEQIGQVAGGLAPQKVQALIAGLPTSFDDPRQQVVYELTSALIGPRVVPQGLYQRARELLGDKGIVDVTVLLGWFTGVSLTLAAYDVPSHAAGLIP